MPPAAHRVAIAATHSRPGARVPRFAAAWRRRRTRQGRFGSNVQPGIRCCIATASSRAQPVLAIQRVRPFDLRHVELDAEPRPGRQPDDAAVDAQRILRQALPVLPDPVRDEMANAWASALIGQC
jgi:hypothetical protein